MVRSTLRFGMVGFRRPSPADERGQALIEFALVLFLILLLLFGMVDLGKAVNYWNDETHLANEAVRYAAVNNCAPCAAQGMNINDWIKTQADTNELSTGGGSIAGSGMSVSISFPNGPARHCVGDPVEVRITATYKWLDYFLGKIGPPMTLVGKATMRLEQNYRGDGTDAYSATSSGTTCT